MYVRENNNDALGDLLVGLEPSEAYLMDVNNWVSHAFLQRLYHRMINLLNDPLAVYKMTLASGRFQSLGFLDRLVRLLGDPKVIYGQAPKYNRLIKLNGDVFIREMGPTWVLLEDCYHDGSIKTRHDCDYTRGILSGIPALFGLPTARIEELTCQVSKEKYGRRIWPDNPEYGAKGCLYRIEFDTVARPHLWRRLFQRSDVYKKAIEDLINANRTIQEKYNQVIQLVADLDSVNQQLLETTMELEESRKKLALSENKYRLIAENASDIIWIYNLATRECDYVSPSARKILNLSDQDPLEMKLENVLTPQSYQRAREKLVADLTMDSRGDLDPNHHHTSETELMRKDGSTVWTEARMTFMRDKDQRPIGLLGVSRDITERKASQAALNAEKERLAVTLRSIGDGVITTDQSGAVTLINPVAEKLTGWTESEATGKKLKDIFTIVDANTRLTLPPPTEAIINGGKADTISADSLLIDRTGLETNIAYNVAPILDTRNQVIGAVLVFQDITTQRTMEKELQKMEKLESLGVLAGGIAHDFNNFLTGIIGNLSLAKLNIKTNTPAYARLHDMEKATVRAKNLTQQLLTFSKGGDPVKKATEMTHLVREAAVFATRGSNVRCDFDFSVDGHYSNVDEGQVVQVIHNLILNAVQAMPKGGTIRITGTTHDLPQENGTSLAAGPYVKFTIHDQGIGIKAQHLQNIFDPYFTTKNKGSGLGLAVAYAIIDKHGGRIQVESELGVGTTFTILLPTAPSASETAHDGDPPPTEGQGHILVMDDEDFIRELAQEMLTTLGYSVTLARDGGEAVELYKAAREKGSGFDAVILDLTVPAAMGGKEAIKHMLNIDEKVKAIVSSGYSNDPVMSNYEAHGFSYAVKKPYRVQEIGQALALVLKSDGPVQ